MSETKPRVLCVDDEPNILDGLKRHLRKHFDVQTAEGSRQGLELMASQEEAFAVVVSDLRMPEMNGIEFLQAVMERSSDTTRILLTGDADLTAAVSAVNDGNIFRFLTKPCPNELLIQSVHSAAEQHQLVIAERVLLESTLHGCVKMLTEMLALANPTAFGRAARVKQKAGEVAARLGAPARWQMELAAMLSQVASITLPGDTVEKMSRGEDLSIAERKMVDRLPQMSQDLIAGIPRLSEVRCILEFQNSNAGEAAGDDLIGARILRAVADLDSLETDGVPLVAALDALRLREGLYDGQVLDALASLGSVDGGRVLELDVAELRSGMMLLDAVETPDGRLLVARGQEVSVGMLERLRNFGANGGVKEPLRVMERA